MKKAISILLSVIIAFSCVNFSFVPVNAITDYTTGETEDGIFYRIDNETGELTVTWADFNTTDLVIPAYIDGKPVTTIGDNFLCDTPNPNLRSVVIPDTVKNIRFNAFANCINLESVVMSENIEYVEDCVFFNTALTNDESNWDNGSLYIGKLLYGVSTDYSGEFVIKDGTRVIGSNCFCSRYSGNGCEKITNIVIPDSVVSIGVFSFYNCISLTSIDIPDSVKYIDNVAFSQCINLSTININTSNLTYVGQNILRGTAYYYDSSNWQDDVLYLNTAALCGKDDIEDLVIKEGTEIIADYAFGCKSGVSSVSLPNSLRIICDLAFDDLHALPSIELPDGVEYIGKSAFDGCDLLTELDIPNSVNYIGLFAFNRTDNLEKLIIRNPECTIIDNHEEYAGGAYSVNPNTTVYGYTGSTAEVFANNNGVNFVQLFEESGTTGDCTWTFDNISKELYIKSNNSYIQLYGYSYGKSPWFSFKDSIKTVTLDSNIYSIGENCFTDCTALETVIMPGVYKVGDNAFSGCSSLKHVELSSEYTMNATIGKYAFAYCYSLEKVLLPFKGVTISEKAFFCCDNLTTLGIYVSPKIENNAFLNCPQLSSIYMLSNGAPFSYGTISNTAFSGVIANVYYNYSYSPGQNNAYGGQFNFIKMTSGIVGYNAYWNYDPSNEKLTITGKGRLFGYSSGSDLPWTDAHWSGNASSIQTIVIEDGITAIPSYSFEYLRNVESVSLPNTLLKLYPNAFNDCASLTEIAIPASVEYVDGKTYWNRCTNLTDVYYIGTEQEWNEVYSWAGSSYGAGCITPHFLVYHPSTQSCTQAGYPAHYEFDGTAKDTFYDLNKAAIPTPESKKLDHTFSKAWTKDENNHWHVCTLCGTEISDKTNHSFDNSCDTVCNVCGYTRTIEHNYAEEYTSDDNSHWRVCSVCGDKTDMGLHTWDGGVITTKPTCTETGVKTYTCTICHKIRTEEIEATGHTIVTDVAVPATCEKSGLTEGSYCSVCHAILKAQEVIPANGHSVVIDKAVAPTCTETGLTEGSHCSVCHAIFKAQEVIPANGHSVVIDKAVAPTCTETGLTEGSHCSVCHAILKAQEVIPANGHSVVIDKAVAPTCTETGLTEGSHCSVCHAILKAQEVIPANGHSVVIDKAVAPTCTETGLTEGSHCSVCHAILKAQEVIPANGHSVVIDKAVAPTCTETGLTEGSHCSVCHAILKAQEVIPANNHSIVIDKAVAPTCTETGLTEGSHCSVCHAILKAQEVIPANGHSVVLDKAVAPTCTETGLTEGSHCSVCHEIFKAQEVIPANGHTIVTDKGYPASCTETGLTDGSHCSVCHEILKAQEVIPANGHSWNNGVVTTPATCHADGLKTFTCTECGKTKTEVIPQLEHIWNDGVVSKQPTYTEKGEITYTCTLCGDTYTEDIPKLAKKGKLVVSNETVRAGDTVQVMIYLEENPGITALSIDVEFSEHFTLKNIKYTDLLQNRPSNSPLSNNPFTISWASSTSSDIDSTGLFATLTFEVGLDTPVDDYPIYISYNANNVFDSELNNVPLVIDEGIVNVLKPTPGDVNRDGNINMKDLVLIQQFINHWEVNIVESAADVNDDSEINMKDLVLLQRYINGWEVVLL